MSQDPTSVRTEADGDVVAKIIDATATDSLEINSSGEALVAATDFDIRPLSSTQDEVQVVQSTASNLNATVVATDFDIRDLTSASDSVEVLQDTHDDLNLNANMQVADTDVSDTNPVPTYLTDEGGQSPQAFYSASATLASQASETLSFAISNGTTGRMEQVMVSSDKPWKAEVQTFDGTSATTVAVFYGEAGDMETFDPQNKGSSLFQQANTGSGEEFRVIVTNNNKSGVGQSGEIHVTWEHDEV